MDSLKVIQFVRWMVWYSVTGVIIKQRIVRNQPFQQTLSNILLTIDGDRLGPIVRILLGLFEGETVTGLELFDECIGDYVRKIQASID
jgi:hypothetical protein